MTVLSSPLKCVCCMKERMQQWFLCAAHAVPRAGQHLLSAVCDEVTGADTVSWELHAPKGLDDDVAIDLAIPSVSSEQLQVLASPTYLDPDNSWCRYPSVEHRQCASYLHADAALEDCVCCSAWSWLGGHAALKPIRTHSPSILAEHWPMHPACRPSRSAATPSSAPAARCGQWCWTMPAGRC